MTSIFGGVCKMMVMKFHKKLGCLKCEDALRNIQQTPVTWNHYLMGIMEELASRCKVHPTNKTSIHHSDAYHRREERRLATSPWCLHFDVTLFLHSWLCRLNNMDSSISDWWKLSMPCSWLNLWKWIMRPDILLGSGIGSEAMCVLRLLSWGTVTGKGQIIDITSQPEFK